MDIPEPAEEKIPVVASQKKEKIEWDFRDGQLPNGIEVVGENAQFFPSKDGSMALQLGPESFLRINMTDLDGIGGKLINEYTLTMDILVDNLPNESISLFQASNRTDMRPTEGEAFIYNNGGVGVFGEVGVGGESGNSFVLQIIIF